MSNEMAIIKVVNKDQISYGEQEEVKAKFERDVKFIKTALDMSDDKMDKVKVVEMGKLVEKSKKEITVGKMRTLMVEEKGGVTQGVFNFFRKIFDR